jgi:hypothetical protein
MEKKECLLVFTSQMARQLLRMGYTIKDIKPDKTDAEGKRSVFLFKNEKNLEQDIKKLIAG